MAGTGDHVAPESVITMGRNTQHGTREGQTDGSEVSDASLGYSASRTTSHPAMLAKASPANAMIAERSTTRITFRV